jgi:hypothetical protein
MGLRKSRLTDRAKHGVRVPLTLSTSWARVKMAGNPETKPGGPQPRINRLQVFPA